MLPPCRWLVALACLAVPVACEAAQPLSVEAVSAVALEGLADRQVPAPALAADGLWPEPDASEAPPVPTPLPAVWRMYLPQSPHRQSGMPRTLVMEAYEDPVSGQEIAMFLHDETGWRQFENIYNGSLFAETSVAYEQVGSQVRVSPRGMEPVWLDLSALEGLKMEAFAIEDSFVSDWPLVRLVYDMEDVRPERECTLRTEPDDQAPVALVTLQENLEAYLAARAIPFERPNVDVFVVGERRGDWLPVEVMINAHGQNLFYCGDKEPDQQVVRIPGWMRFRTSEGEQRLRHSIELC